MLNRFYRADECSRWSDRQTDGFIVEYTALYIPCVDWEKMHKIWLTLIDAVAFSVHTAQAQYVY